MRAAKETAAAVGDGVEAVEETAAVAEEVVAEAAAADAIAWVALLATATWGAKKKVDGLAMHGGTAALAKGLKVRTCGRQPPW